MKELPFTIRTRGGLIGPNLADGSLEFVNLLGCLQRLDHLALYQLISTEELPPLPVSVQKDFDKVVGGLSSLKVVKSSSALLERVCTGATSLETLNLENSAFPSFRTQLPPLLHLKIAADDKNLEEVWASARNFHKTIETLYLRWCTDWLDGPFSNVQPLSNTFDKVTHLFLSPPQIFDFRPIQSLLDLMPFLRYLRWQD